MPDSLWNNKLWEFKRASSKTSIDDRIRKAKHQLVEGAERCGTEIDGSGIAIDIANRTMPQNEAIQEITRVSLKRGFNSMEIIIKEKSDFLKAIRIKK